MKKDLGSVMGLYPTPMAVVGAMVDEKPNWVLVGHVGIIGHDRILIRLAKSQYPDRGIWENGARSVNMVGEAMLEKADYVGCFSGKERDKSQVFGSSVGRERAPLLEEAKLSMECLVDDLYQTQSFDSFIVKISHTYAQEEILNEAGVIDYGRFKPVLFEMPGYTYLKTGERLARCTSLAKKEEADA